VKHKLICKYSDWGKINTSKKKRSKEEKKQGNERGKSLEPFHRHMHKFS